MSDEQIGCGDNSCIFSVLRTSGGMGTNGGCRCFDALESWIESEKRWNRAEIQKVRRDVLRLAREVARLRGIVPELPPRAHECGGLPRYGVRWSSPTEPLAIPMVTGYWTPWHLAEAEVKRLREALEGVVGVCPRNCDEESNCGVCAVALRGLAEKAE